MTKKDCIFEVNGVKGNFFRFQGHDFGPYKSQKECLKTMTKLKKDYINLIENKYHSYIPSDEKQNASEYWFC